MRDWSSHHSEYGIKEVLIGTTDHRFRYDNLRLSSRSIDGLMQMASASIGKDSFPTKLQNHLIYLLDFEEGMPEDEKALLLRFIAALENSLGVKTEMVTIENRWRENPPKGSNGDSIWTYMGKVKRNA